MRSIIAILVMVLPILGDEVLPGTAVSQPLSPVQVPEKPDPPAEAAKEEPPEVIEEKQANPLNPEKWSSYEVLMWWSKGQSLPTLATGANGAPLVAGTSLGDGMYTGFRFTMGWSIVEVNGVPTWGLEFGGLFSGTRVNGARFESQNATLARPYIDANTGRAQALVVAGPALGIGAIEANTTTRVQGWEVNLTRNLVECGEMSVAAFGGYRYLAVNEGINISQTSLRIPPGQAPNALWNLYDQFDGRNNFHGAQIGLRIDSAHGNWLFGFSGRIAIGANFQTSAVSGSGTLTTAALPVLAVQPLPGGFLAQSTNIGKTVESSLTYVPEARINIGYKIGSNCHFCVGYDFLYLSSAVRPADQIDTVVDPARVPILNAGNFGPGPARPMAMFNKSDFWLQGLALSFDCRY